MLNTKHQRCIEQIESVGHCQTKSFRQKSPWFFRASWDLSHTEMPSLVFSCPLRSLQKGAQHIVLSYQLYVPMFLVKCLLHCGMQSHLEFLAFALLLIRSIPLTPFCSWFSTLCVLLFLHSWCLPYCPGSRWHQTVKVIEEELVGDWKGACSLDSTQAPMGKRHWNNRMGQGRQGRGKDQTQELSFQSSVLAFSLWSSVI